MSTASVKRDLLNSLRDQEFREAFVLENVYTSICFQMRALREQRELSQLEFGRQIEPPMAQERISILEDPNAKTKPAINSLLRVANAAGVALDIRFIPLAKLLDRAVHTDMGELRVNSFEEDWEAVEKQIEFELAMEAARANAARRDIARMGTAMDFLAQFPEGNKNREPSKKKPQSAFEAANTTEKKDIGGFALV